MRRNAASSRPAIAGIAAITHGVATSERTSELLQ
jgi:hypothetical protein